MYVSPIKEIRGVDDLQLKLVNKPAVGNVPRHPQQGQQIAIGMDVCRANLSSLFEWGKIYGKRTLNLVKKGSSLHDLFSFCHIEG
uniref:Uncharacterized protein n=1 Tax=Nelumbo nucifera TaxID=4432 RepID=A0A822YWW0_NELNU|nr:TPA_asm: hypothetical protein HUJ06_007668 [Nelumbo nucifera]